jgi:hypothetical protein
MEATFLARELQYDGDARARYTSIQKGPGTGGDPESATYQMTRDNTRALSDGQCKPIRDPFSAHQGPRGPVQGSNPTQAKQFCMSPISPNRNYRSAQ